MEFEINSEYHGKTPMIKYVILKNVGNPIIELLNGNVDASSNVGPDLIKILDDAENDWAPGWEERRNLKIWAIFQEDFPLTYLHPLVLVSVAHRRIKGLERSHQIHPEFSMEHLWIEEDK